MWINSDCNRSASTDVRSSFSASRASGSITVFVDTEERNSQIARSRAFFGVHSSVSLVVVVVVAASMRAALAAASLDCGRVSSSRSTCKVRQKQRDQLRPVVHAHKIKDSDHRRAVKVNSRKDNIVAGKRRNLNMRMHVSRPNRDMTYTKWNLPPVIHDGMSRRRFQVLEPIHPSITGRSRRQQGMTKEPVIEQHDVFLNHYHVSSHTSERCSRCHRFEECGLGG